MDLSAGLPQVIYVVVTENAEIKSFWPIFLQLGHPKSVVPSSHTCLPTQG